MGRTPKLIIKSLLWRAWASSAPCLETLQQGRADQCAGWVGVARLVAISWWLWVVILEPVQQEQD